MPRKHRDTPFSLVTWFRQTSQNTEQLVWCGHGHWYVGPAPLCHVLPCSAGLGGGLEGTREGLRGAHPSPFQKGNILV